MYLRALFTFCTPNLLAEFPRRGREKQSRFIAALDFLRLAVHTRGRGKRRPCLGRFVLFPLPQRPYRIHHAMCRTILRHFGFLHKAAADGAANRRSVVAVRGAVGGEVDLADEEPARAVLQHRANPLTIYLI